MYALAHATGKTGRFTLIERWRNNERLLAPNEYPLKVSSGGRYCVDCVYQFVCTLPVNTISTHQVDKLCLLKLRISFLDTFEMGRVLQ